MKGKYIWPPHFRTSRGKVCPLVLPKACERSQGMEGQTARQNEDWSSGGGNLEPGLLFGEHFTLFLKALTFRGQYQIITKK